MIFDILPNLWKILLGLAKISQRLFYLDIFSLSNIFYNWKRDHAGGNADLVKLYSNPLDVLGGDDRIGALTRKVTHGDVVNIGGLKIECLFTPCHTQGHICYHVTSELDEDVPAVFTGM